jgi:NADH:ubiquinone oxidoreductase subunit 4 (chain M)
LGVKLLINFISQDMPYFDLYFEASLVPLFILIGSYKAANKDKTIYIYNINEDFRYPLNTEIIQCFMTKTTPIQPEKDY